jgi:hypothetical protein
LTPKISDEVLATVKKLNDFRDPANLARETSSSTNLYTAPPIEKKPKAVKTPKETTA